METYSDPDNDGLGKVVHGDEDQDIVIDAEHSSREVDLEGDGESVTGVCEDLNYCLRRILFPRLEEEENGVEEELSSFNYLKVRF